jgi:SEC-C motif-containing protein
MRSRWSAFALGLGVYLVDTLSEGHPERTPAARAAAIRELSRIRERQRFLRLVILDEGVPSTAESTEGEVLFHARIFEKGQDRSFAELSRFVREARHWRYDSGILLPTERLPDDPATLDRERFLELSRRISAAGGGG